MTNPIRAGLLITRLSLADLWYDKKVSFCIIASIISVITPLLLLFSLKYGVISQLRYQLLLDPQNLEVKTVGNLQFDRSMFDWLKAQPEVGFVIPLTRSLNTQADLLKTSSLFINNVDILPTAAGDPLTQNLPPITNKKQMLLTAPAAEKMAVTVGDTIKMVITRQLARQLEKGITELQVVGIIPESRYNRAAAFVSLPLLIDMEDFYDGYRSDVFITGTGLANPPLHTSFARARLYAKSLNDVAPLALKLRQKQIDTRTQANAIEKVQAIDRVLNFIFSVIAITALLGCVLSLVGSFLSNIERKRRDIAFMRLIGFQSTAIMLYLTLQSMLLSCVAFIISYLLFLMGSQAVNLVLGKNLPAQSVVTQQSVNQQAIGDHVISQLQGEHLLIAFLLTLLIAIIVVILGGRRAVKIQPAESLREL
ncbi:FtsX-like permease family protein [Orbaceae bacterium ESL0727]|nr:FtsX-like permease family protein [Orbaceae bacterium ESL0727]